MAVIADFLCFAPGICFKLYFLCEICADIKFDTEMSNPARDNDYFVVLCSVRLI